MLTARPECVASMGIWTGGPGNHAPNPQMWGPAKFILELVRVPMLGFQLRMGNEDSSGVTHYWQVYPWQADYCHPSSVSCDTIRGTPGCWAALFKAILYPLPKWASHELSATYGIIDLGAEGLSSCSIILKLCPSLEWSYQLGMVGERCNIYSRVSKPDNVELMGILSENGSTVSTLVLLKADWQNIVLSVQRGRRTYALSLGHRSIRKREVKQDSGQLFPLRFVFARQTGTWRNVPKAASLPISPNGLEERRASVTFLLSQILSREVWLWKYWNGRTISYSFPHRTNGVKGLSKNRCKTNLKQSQELGVSSRT